MLDNNMTIEHREVEVKLPKRDSNLWHTLMAVATLKKANSAEITQKLAETGQLFTVSDVSSYLTFLRTKRLVANVEIRRGVAGGSTWILTDPCAELVGVNT